MSFGWWNKFCFFLFSSLKFFGSSPSKKKKRKIDLLPRLVSFGWWNKFCFFLFGSLKFLVLRPQKKKFLVIRHSLDPRLLRFKFLRFPFFFFFFHAFSPTGGTVYIRYMNSSRNFWPVFHEQYIYALFMDP